MLCRPCAARCDNRYGYRVCNNCVQFIVISGLCAVAVHAGKENLPRAHVVRLHGPFYSIEPRIDTAAVFVYIPAASVFPPSGIDGNDHTLAPEFICSLGDQFRCIDGRGIDGYLIRPLPQKQFKIINRTDTAAHGKWNKNCFRHAAHHIHHRAPVIGGSRNVQKNQFIRPGLIVCGRDLHRISCIL